MNNKNQDLSIIIVSYNTKTLLKSCLESIAAPATPKRSDDGQANSQPSNVNYEIIIVDNNSSDGSKKYLKSLESKGLGYRKKPNSKPPNPILFKVIFNDRNLGFAKAVNQGIEVSQGKHILLLNSDTRLKLKTLKKMLTFVNKNKNVGVVGPRLINPDGTTQPSCYNFQTITNAVKEFWLGHKNTFSKYYPQTKQPTEVDALVGAVLLITKQALNKVGKLDEKYFLYYEDLDYCRRVREAGLKVYYLPNIEVVHQHGASGKSNADKTNQWLIESSKKYHGLIKHYLISFIIWSGQKCRRL